MSPPQLSLSGSLPRRATGAVNSAAHRNHGQSFVKIPETEATPQAIIETFMGRARAFESSIGSWEVWLLGVANPTPSPNTTILGNDLKFYLGPLGHTQVSQLFFVNKILKPFICSF